MSTSLPPRRTIEILRVRQKVGVTVVTFALAALTVLVFVDVVRQADLTTGERVIGSVVGAVFGGIAALFLVDLPGILGRHRLVVDHDGLGYDVWISRVKTFRVAWVELAGVALSTADKRTRASRRTFVRLDLLPSEPEAFASRHPEMSVLRNSGGAGENVWRLGFGPNGSRVAELDEALRGYAGGRYRGVDDDGRATGWTYR